MNDSEYDKIDQYLKGKMSGEELQDFEQKMKIDESLAAAVALQTDLIKGIEIFGDQQLRANIQLAEKNTITGKSTQEQPHPKRIILFSIRNLAIAATFLILIVAGYFLLKPSDPSPNLYASYFEMDQLGLANELEELSLIGMAITDRERRDQLKSALELIEAGQYEEATTALKTHLATYPKDDAATYFLGLSLMQTTSYEEAINVLAPIAANQESEYNEAAHWFRALSWLQIKGAQEKVIQQLKQIAGSSSSYSDQSTRLLKDLNASE